MNPLTPHEVEQLVSLRLGLQDALSRAKRTTKYRRGAAIVALDGTVERASSIVAISRGITVPTNGKLDDLISRLVQDFGRSWRPAVLPDIKHLRRARNASQHEGLEPDRDQVPLWASATEAYVSGLIEAQFSVDIRRVVLSDAIRDPDLRERMREAELSRDSDDHRSCVDHSKAAYHQALKKWKGLGRVRARGFAPMHTDVIDRKSYEHLQGKLSNVQAVLESSAFSPNSAEAEWFMAAIAEQGNVLDAEDSERVLAFAFEWVVGYEQAAESWTPDRRHRTAVAQRIVGREDRPARIQECLMVDLYHGDVRSIFRIADVPDEEEYPQWAQILRELLSPREQDIRWTISDDGTVQLLKKIEHPAEFASELASLTSALNLAHDVVKEKLAAAAETDRNTQKRRSGFAGSIRAIRDDLPTWVERIELADGRFTSDEEVLLTVSEEVIQLRFGGRSQGYYDDRKSLRDIILDHELVTGCYGTGEYNQLGLWPVLDPQQWVNVFKDIDPTVRERLAFEVDQKAQENKIIGDVKASIAALLPPLPSAGQ